MGMMPDDFFETFVRGNYEDCIDYLGSLRKAFNAAVSTSHLADHYFYYYKKHDSTRIKNFAKIGDFVEHLSKETGGYFQDIRSIANAYKHLYTGIDPKKAVHSTVSSTGAIESISFDYKNAEIKELQEEGNENDYKETKVVFTKKAGSRLDFLFVLKKVVDYWESSGLLP